jgi:predicted Zn-dependent peptidase
MNAFEFSGRFAARLLAVGALCVGSFVGAAWAQDAKAAQDSKPAAKPLHDGTGPRDERPTDYPPRDFTPPTPLTFKLANGVPVMLWTKRELPLVAVHVQFKGGGPLDEPQASGRSELTATMLGEGAGDLDATAFADTMQGLGATFSSGASEESAAVGLTVLKRNFDKALGLVGDAILRPRMESVDWDRVKRLHLDDLKQEDDEPTVVAGRVGMRVLFGTSNPYGWPVAGTPATVTKLTLDDIKARHKAFYTPGRATILVSGDVTQEEAKAALEKVFGAWKSDAAEKPAEKSKPSLAALPGESLRMVLVDRPQAVQTVVRFYTPGYPMADDRRVRLRLLNELLGGSFTSRLNQNLREAHGYTYGAGSSFAMEPSAGFWSARASVVADKTGPSLKEFMSEFERIRKGDITAEEVSKARESLKTDLVQRFQGIGGVLGMAGNLLEAGLPYETLGADEKAMKSVTAEELNKLAPKVLPIETGVLVLVGDKKLILDQIKDLKLPAPVEYTVQGDPK